MPAYYVYRREVWTQGVEIMADTPEDAIERVANNEGECMDGLFEYSHTRPKEEWVVILVP